MGPLNFILQLHTAHTARVPAFNRMAAKRGLRNSVSLDELRKGGLRDSSVNTLIILSFCIQPAFPICITIRIRSTQSAFHSAKQTATVPPTGEGGVKEGQGLLPSYGRGVRWTRCAWRTGRPGGPFLTIRHSQPDSLTQRNTRVQQVKRTAIAAGRSRV